MTAKVCTKCKQSRPVDEFYRNQVKNGKVFYKSQCRDCVLENRKQYQAKNRAKILARKKQHYKENRDRIKAAQKVWRDSNLQSRLVRNAKRRAAKLQATLPLTPDQEEQIKDFYWLAKDLSSVTGEAYHVDHIVPLQGKTVCGLHVPWNLQVLPADINLSKGNKHGNLA